MKKNAFIFSVLVLTCFFFTVNGQRWQMRDDGSIRWTVGKGDVHTDHIEMSGRHVSVILTYGTDAAGRLTTSKRLVFPMLRTIPNNTHGNVLVVFGDDNRPSIKINNRQVRETVHDFTIKGTVASHSDAGQGITIDRLIYPSMDKPAVIERITVSNHSGKTAAVELEQFDYHILTQPEKSVYGVYDISARSFGHGVFDIPDGGSRDSYVLYEGRLQTDAPLSPDFAAELAKREAFVEQMFGNIRFVSPEPVLDRMFDFAKIRAMESIFETRGGLVHGPGGGSYYAAIWANDQAEYANPFFAYTGYDTAIESAMVSWEWFARYMNPEYLPIPSSIIAEGTGYWNGAGDRGDMAMIAYGASRFALSFGDKDKAREIWPLIEWCLEYCRRQLDSNGVVASDSDELENRFPSGDANLCTSSLYYDALISSAMLARDLGMPSRITKGYEKQAKELHRSIEKFFGANVQGFDTYRYYDGNDLLRSWICIPLSVGIFDRREGTIDALFSPKLWTDDGLLTQQGSETFWDRSTLYGLRGALYAGETVKAMPFLLDYSKRRLTGDHVPYAVEAWPEGNQRHLSAESALYCRVVTEGLFGYRPTGLRSFTLTPQLPEGWDFMELQNIHAHGKVFDIAVTRTGDGILVNVQARGEAPHSFATRSGAEVRINFPE